MAGIGESMCVSPQSYGLWLESPDKSMAKAVLFKCNLNSAAIQMHWPIKRGAKVSDGDVEYLQRWQ